jgi:hypothetical protein
MPLYPYMRVSVVRFREYEWNYKKELLLAFE